MNSILQYVSGESLSAHVALRIASHYTDNKILVVVEGKDDRDIYSRFYSDVDYEVYYDAKFCGCMHFPKMVESLNVKYRDRYIVIKDADNDRLSNKEDSLPENLFLTDGHDLEMMMVTESFLSTISSKYNVGNVRVFVHDALHDIVWLSYMRWLNHEKDWKLSINDVSGRFCANEECTPEALIHAVSSCSSNYGKACLCELSCDCLYEMGGRYPVTCFEDLVELTRGHDMVSVLSNRLQNYCKANVSRRDVISMLQDKFDEYEYSKTNLYVQVNSWLGKLPHSR